MRKLLFAAGLISAAIMSGCTLQKMVKMAADQQITVTPSPLEVHGDTVAFEMSVVLPQKMLRNDKVYTVNTFYQYGDKELEVGSIDFVANEYTGTEQPRKSKRFAFPYQSEMSNGDLMVQGIAKEEKNPTKFRETEKMKVAEGVIATSRMVKDQYAAIYADHGYNNQEELIPTRVEFHFYQGSSTFTNALGNREKKSNLDAFIAEKNVTRTVTITGTHSPEGPERVNKNLSQNRAKVIEDYYRRQMRKYDYKGMAEEINFQLKPVVEDWTDFKEALRNYDGISEDEKDKYLEIVNGRGSFEEKEDQLHRLSTYRKVFNDIYPGLRAAKTEVLTAKDKKSDAEISVLAKQITQNEVNEDTLNNKELMYAATLTPSLKEKEAIYQASIKKEDTWVAHNNLAATYLEMAKQSGDMKYVDMAMTQLEIAQKKNAYASEIQANMATAYYMRNQYSKALEHANKAASGLSGENLEKLNGMKGALEIKQGKYDAATRSLSNAERNSVNNYNKGLAQTLNKDYANAMVSEEEVTEADSGDARAYYVAAVAAARAGNEDKVYSYLEKAVDADPSMADKAMNDLEFREYRDSSEFQNAMK
jgi:tetratricopeptide (TPR) repeat protein